jgi:O-antigen/teichoic acid export membrane protein
MTAFGWVAGGIINVIFLFYFFLKNKFTIKFSFRNFDFINLVKESFSLSAASLIAQFVVSFPIIYLGSYYSAGDAGIFSAAFRIITFILVIDRVFNIIFFPKIIKYYNETPEKLQEIFNTVLKIISILVISLAVLIIIAGDLITVLVFGEKFADASLSLKILSGFFAFSTISSVFTYTLIGINREIEYTKALFWSMIIFLVIIYVLDGVTQSAISLVVFQFAALLIMAVKMSQLIKINLFKYFFLPAAAASIILFGLLSIEVNFYLKTAIAIIIGLPVIALSGGINSNDFKFLKRIFI